MNDYQFKVVRIEGEFIWHAHPETDEAFLVLEGTLRIDLPDGPVYVAPGELYVVPRGMQHRGCGGRSPVADDRAAWRVEHRA